MTLHELPAGYYAVPDPDDPNVITYWRVTRPRGRGPTRLIPWPAGAHYGPPRPRRADAPQQADQLREYLFVYRDRLTRHRDQVTAAITANPAAAAKRFADLTTRCHSCGRPLTDPASKTYGLGPDCRAGIPPRILATYLTAAIGRAHAAHEHP